MTTVDLPNIREPFIDPRSGQISRPWWIWLQQLMGRIGGSNGTDISVIEALVRQLIKDVLALERATSDNPQGQINAGLALQIEELQAFVADERGHGFWEDPDMHAAATPTSAGFMSATDKLVLDALNADHVPNARTLTAGAGLTGGGNLSADRTFNVVANADGSIVVNADDIQVGVLATDAQHGVRGGGTQHAVATTLAAGFMSAADKAKLDGFASSYFSAYASTGQAAGAGAVLLVICDTQLNDALGEYDPTTGVFTAAATGLYVFHGHVFGTQTTSTNRQLMLYVNGAEVIRMQQLTSSSGASAIGGTSGLVNLNAGNTVTMRYLSTLADTTATGASATNFSGWRVA